MKKVNLKDFEYYYNKGLNNSEIAKKLNVTVSCISYICKKLNKISNFKYSCKISEKDYMDLYNQGLKDTEIFSILGLENTNAIKYTRDKLKLKDTKYKRYEFTEEQNQILLGCLLGDGHLRKQRKYPLFVFSHSLKQEQYLYWKCSFFNDFFNIKNRVYFDKRTNKNYYKLEAYSRVTPSLEKYYDLFYKNKKKIITEDLLNMLTPLGLAVWFMDDGYNHVHGYYISTNCFSNEEIYNIMNYFKEKYNINCSKHKNNILYIKKDSCKIFEDLIKDYIHDTLNYKLKTVRLK